MNRSYIHPIHGLRVFVAQGLTDTWGTFYRLSERCGLHRVKSPAMPMVADRETAQANLDAWATKNRLREVEGGLSGANV